MHDITFIIPVLGRDFYTRVWMNNNLRNDCYYIFADGSHDDSNYKLFKENKSNNVKYIKFNQDHNHRDYIKKIADVSLQIKTKYTMTSDNDDFLNYEGIFKCVDFLDNNSQYDFASGNTIFVRQNDAIDIKKVKYKLAFDISHRSSKNLDNLTGINGIESFLDRTIKNTNYLWYSVYRSKLYANIMSDMYKSNIVDGQINEYLQTCMSFCHGKYKYINCNHYLRLANPTENYNSSTFSEFILVRLVFDENTKKDFITLIDCIAKKLKIDREIVYNTVKKMLIPVKNPNLRIMGKPIHKINLISLYNTLNLVVLYKISRVINLKYYTLTSVIRIVNIYYMIKNKFNKLI